MTPVSAAVIRRSGDGENYRAALRAVLPEHLLELGRRWKDFRADVTVQPLGNIHLLRQNFRGALTIQVPNSRYYIQGFPIRGTAETVNNRLSATSSLDVGVPTEPGEVCFSTVPEFEHIAMLIEPEALFRTVTTLTGGVNVGKLKFAGPLAQSPSAYRISRSLVNMLVDELDDEHSAPSPLVVAELAQSLLVAFVCGINHNYSHLLDREPARMTPRQVRLVEEYIIANWAQPISIEALAIVGNASARSIFQSFKVHRGYTPMSFLKDVRLGHAREMLRMRPHGSTVTTVAYTCGFGNLGHFARDYQRMFGEKPSVTLQRARSDKDLDPRAAHAPSEASRW